MEPKKIVLIGGGVRSGKSSLAVSLGKKLGTRRAFVATAKRSDGEMTARIDRHQRERRDEFVTFEEPLALAETLAALPVDYDVVVVDCLTLWLSNLLLRRESVETILEQVDGLITVLAVRQRHAVVVTNEVGMSLHAETALGRAFQEVTGWAHQRLSRASDEVYLAVLGTCLRIRPSPLLVTETDLLG